MTHKILIIEDDKMDRELICHAIKKLAPESELIICKSYKDGLSAYRNAKNIDLIFLDLNLPDNWGISSVKDVRKYCTKTPIIVMTGIAGDLTISESLLAGAKDVLIKSFITPENIQQTIAQYAA